MTNSERMLAATFLREASSVFGRHGCNDVPSEIFRDLSVPEKTRLEEHYNKWNDPNGDTEEYTTLRHIPDFAWMSYLAHLIELEIA
jgi:hypothetical protein